MEDSDLKTRLIKCTYINLVPRAFPLVIPARSKLPREKPWERGCAYMCTCLPQSVVNLCQFFFQDLCDRLYDICDNRKELAEKERQSVMSEGWLEDRLGLLTNFYVTLMQAEVDRYQDTVRLLRDYYVGMEGELLTINHLVPELQPNRFESVVLKGWKNTKIGETIYLVHKMRLEHRDKEIK